MDFCFFTWGGGVLVLIFLYTVDLLWNLESGHYSDYLRSALMGPPEAGKETGVAADLALQLFIIFVVNA